MVHFTFGIYLNAVRRSHTHRVTRLTTVARLFRLHCRIVSVKLKVLLVVQAVLEYSVQPYSCTCV